MRKKLLKIAPLLLSLSLNAQTSVKEKIIFLPKTIQFVDSNQDDIIQNSEAKIIFDQYLNNSGKKIKNELVDEVESTTIELISHLEGIDCSDIKKSIASKRFIEIYYNNKFIKTSENNTNSDLTNHSIIAESDTFKYDFSESIVTDRPDQTEAPDLTPQGFFQVEIGTQSEFDNDNINNVSTQSTLYNTTLWKYGVSKNFELRLITEYANDKMQYKVNSDFGDTSISVQGFNPIAIGSKIHLQKEKGIIPEISLITHLELPYFGSIYYKPEFVIPRFRFLFAHSLSERFTFSYNLGAEWEDGTSATTGIYTASLGASLFGNLSMFIEAYGFLKEKDAPDNRLDAGFTYLLNNNIQLDCSGGIGLNEKSPDYFMSAGISFRFNAFNKEIKQQRLSQFKK